MEKLLKIRMKKHIVLFFIICILAYLSACSTAYRPKYLKLSKVPLTQEMPIDGVWKSSKGGVFQFEKGRSSAVSVRSIKKGGVNGKNIQPVAPGIYTLEWLTWNTKTEKSGYGPARIRIIGPTQLGITIQPNTTTGVIKDMKEIRLTNIRFDNAFSYLQEWERMERKEDITEISLKAYKNIVRRYPKASFVAQARKKIENIEGEQLKTSDRVDVLRLYLKIYPTSEHSLNVKNRLVYLEQLWWQTAQKKDKVYVYERYILKFPKSLFVEKAQKRMAWQKANRAIVTIDYPDTVSAGSRYYWNTHFKEESGKTSFKLKATDFYIRDPGGGRWSNSWSETVEVKPGGKATIDYWCDKSDKWAGGDYYTIWVGEDGFGNKIKIVQKVHLEK